jgi:uncharacterized protein (DUF1697 family)
MEKFVALLRGINVGGHKKVPMKDLKKTFEKKGFRNVKTLLASGNVVFEGERDQTGIISDAIEKDFGFPVNTIILPFDKIESIVKANPFQKIPVTPDTRFYVTFLDRKMHSSLKIPYQSEDGSFSIIQQDNLAVYSVLDVSKAKTTDVMNILDREFGNGITTRNYNTLVKISKL